MTRIIPWLVEPYMGADATKTYTISGVHGFYIKNFDTNYALTFAVSGLTIPLEPGQDVSLAFKIPPTSAVITNSYTCSFMCGGLD